MGYDIVDEYGNANSRRESGDSAGNKYGSYTINLADGRQRVVEYKADKYGFRAVVKSNEPGTDASQDPADVDAQGIGGYVAAAPAKPARYANKAVIAPAPSYARTGYARGPANGYAGGYGAGYGTGYGTGSGNEYGYGVPHRDGRNRGSYGRGSYGGYGRPAYNAGGHSRAYNSRASAPVYRRAAYNPY